MLTKDRFIIPMELELPDIPMEAEPSYGGLPNSHSASGEMVSFVTDIPYRLGDLKVGIEAVQDLHGYDAPWVGGARKNLASPLELGTVSESSAIGTNYDGVKLTSTTRMRSVDLIRVGVGNSFTVSFDTATYMVGFMLFDANGGYLGASDGWRNFKTSATTYTAGLAEYVALVVRRVDNGTMSESEYANMKLQLEIGTTATAYEPYSNICPISGWTGANVTRAGKNLYGEAQVNYRVNSTTGEIESASNTNWISNRIGVFGKPYTVTFFDKGDMINGSINIARYKADGSYKDYVFFAYFNNTATPVTYTYTESDVYSIIVYGYQGGGAIAINTAKMQVEIGSTPTAYEPYNGHTYSVTWQTEAGTVYGGTLDVTTGVLTVTWKKRIFTSSDSYVRDVTAGVYVTEHDLVKLSDYRPAIKCDKLQTIRSSGVSWVDYSITAYSDPNNRYPAQNWIYFKVPNISTVNEFKAWLTSIGNLEVIFQLATPQTYQLTPTEVMALLGQNNIWADCGDIENLVYFTIDEVEAPVMLSAPLLSSPSIAPAPAEAPIEEEHTIEPEEEILEEESEEVTEDEGLDR